MGGRYLRHLIREIEVFVGEGQDVVRYY